MKRSTLLIIPALILISTGLFRGPKSEAWFKRKGEPIQARITQIRDSAQATSTAEPVWRLKATWTNSNNQKTYTFEKIFPERPDYRAGDFIDVLIDPKDPTKYYLD
jgi:uncharacterized protein DUF3592